MNSTSQGLFLGPHGDSASRQSPLQHAANDWMEGAYDGTSYHQCSSLSNQQLLDSLCQSYQHSQQGTPSTPQLLPNPFKRSPHQSYLPSDGGLGCSMGQDSCILAPAGEETLQQLVSLSPPQPPQMQWDPPQLPLQLESTSPLLPPLWPDMLLPSSAAALTALPETEEGLKDLCAETGSVSGHVLQQTTASPMLFSLLASPAMGGVGSPSPSFPLMAAASSGLTSPPLGSSLLFGSGWSPNQAQLQDPGGSCHGGYMTQQKYVGGGSRECNNAYEALLTVNGRGGGSPVLDLRPSSSSAASDAANFAWVDNGDTSLPASLARCLDKWATNGGYRNSPLSVPAVPPLFVDSPRSSPPCLAAAAAPVVSMALLPPLPPDPSSPSGSGEDEEAEEQEESDNDALWTAVPRGKRRRGGSGGSTSGAAHSGALKVPRPRVKPIASEAAASATRAAQAAEAVARRVGRKPGRYDHITVDMLSDNGFLDMPIQEAARHLGIGLSVLKRVCREMGLVRWPFRKRQSINNVMQQTKTFLAEDKQAEVLAALEGQLQTLTGTGETFDSATKCYRQACFKLNHKINKLGKREALNPRGAAAARPTPRKPMAISVAAAEKLTLQQLGRSAAAVSSSSFGNSQTQP